MTEHSYRLSKQTEIVGALSLQMTGVRDFDEAVHDLFVDLEARGEEEELVELCPFFGKLWPSARGLARFLEAEGPIDASLTVLEVGCGLALPGLVASLLGATVTLSDFHGQVPQFLERNLASNHMPSLTYRKADWRDSSAALGQFDLVMGSDILYDRSHADDLVRFVMGHLRPKGRVLIADPGRAYLQEFTTRMQSQGFSARIDTKRVVDGTTTKDVFILDFLRKTDS